MRRLIFAFTTLAVALAQGMVVEAEEGPAAAGAFSPAGSLAEARMEHTATLLPDGRVLVVGGWGSAASTVSEEVWEPTTATFGPAVPLAEARMDHTATALPDGRILVIGGATSEGLLASAEVWDPATGTFTPAGSLSEARADHTATLLPDGRVLVIGGLTIDDSDRSSVLLASAEAWDPATATFGPAGSLAVARVYHTATALPDGRVLVIGGWCDDPSSVEIWDPATETFRPADSLGVARMEHTATLLLDGRVLVVGGWDDPGSAENLGPGDRDVRPGRHARRGTRRPHGDALA